MNAIVSFLKKRNTQHPPLHRCFTCLEPRTKDQLQKVVYEVEICHGCATSTGGSADDIAEEIRQGSALPRIGPEVPDPEDLDRHTHIGFSSGRRNRFGEDNGVLRTV